MVTLYSFCMTIPMFGGRVFMDAAPLGTPYPLCIAWDVQGGPVRSYTGTSNVTAVYPCLTVYDQPSTTDSPGAPRVRLLAAMDAIRAAKDSINTHSDGITRFVPGSVQAVYESVPSLDQNAAGRYSATMRFAAQLWRP